MTANRIEMRGLISLVLRRHCSKLSRVVMVGLIRRGSEKIGLTAFGKGVYNMPESFRPLILIIGC
jgi:hypothetical protein